MRKSTLTLALVLSLLTLPKNSAYAAPNPGIPENPVAEWTFLTFLNGNNNLDSFGAQNINAMETVGSTPQVNVVVQWASLAAGDVKRLYIKKDNDPQNVTSPVVQDLGKVDMGDYKNLVDFIQWGVTNYPAKHYLINIWDHGGGWHIMNKKRGGQFSPQDISWDDNSGNSISTKQLGMALTQAAQIIGHKVDIYASDACMMAMVEVAGEMADSVEVYAGSEEVEPGAGWPYDSILSRWTAKPTATASEVATIISEEYVKSYQNGSNGSQEVTFSAFDLSKLGVLEQAVTDLSTKVMTLDAPSRAKFQTAAHSTQVFTYGDYGDLSDFITHLEGQSIVGIESDAYTSVTDALGQFVIATHATTGYPGAHGVSFWLPTDQATYTQYVNKYSDLDFSKNTHWGDALKYVLQDVK